ncbi:MAG: restriction endonuclease [Deltaproteobacteria bacterium]|nr:restriction endonuclease [Deltaproteobacteria bacterium]
MKKPKSENKDKKKEKKMAQRSDLPFGSEFSPSQIELPVLLDLAVTHEGDVKALQAAIQAHFFSAHGGGNEKNQKTLAMSCRLGMKAYVLIDENANLTDFGRKLHALKNDEPKLYETLARHILLNLKGMAMIQCIRDMTVAGEMVNLTSLRDGLAERGIHYPSGGKHPSMMRLWLEKAGVFVGDRWQIDELRLPVVLGTNPADFGVLSRFTSEQRAFLLALANTNVSDPQPANEIVKLAVATYGVKFPEKSLPKPVLKTLVEAGYITATKTTVGRGAKPFMVAPTSKLVADVVTPLLDQLKDQTDPKLLDLLRKPLTEILVELDSEDRYIGGLALEALAFKLMRLLDMNYVATRLRAQATGGAEVDLVFESARLVFSRWQVQCKNTSRVSLDDVAKEVGLTHLLKSNVIVIVSTGDIGPEARRYANKIMAESNLCIVMIDLTDLDSIRENPAHIIDAFNREAHHTMTLKKLEL